MNSSLLARQIPPLFTTGRRESSSVMFFHSSWTRSGRSHGQQRHLHSKKPRGILRPPGRRTSVFASAIAVGLTTALIIHTLPLKKRHWCPVWLLKAWLRAKGSQIGLWPECLQIWIRHKLKLEEIAEEERRDRKRKAAKRQKHKWA